MRYIIRRFVSLFLTLFLVSILTFFAFNIIPGDPAALVAGTGASPERVLILRTQLGLNKSLPLRYCEWLLGLLKFDAGQSLQYSCPVNSLISNRFPVTAWLTLISVMIIVIFSIPLAIFSAKCQNKIFDKIIGALTMLSISVPSFFLGIIFIWIFGIVLKIFAPGNYVDYHQNFIDFLKYLLFPALAVAIPNIGIIVKFLRTSLISQMKSDYVRTAFSKGNTEMVVLRKHVLRNAFTPVMTLLGMIIAEILSGSIVIEQIFGLPGLGRLLISSITFRDLPMVESLVIYIASIVVFINLAVDIVLQIIDPRIRIK
jgi:peptide/nickel transport system permease protein